jgi:hypothetical protein
MRHERVPVLSPTVRWKARPATPHAVALAGGAKVAVATAHSKKEDLIPGLIPTRRPHAEKLTPVQLGGRRMGNTKPGNSRKPEPV